MLKIEFSKSKDKITTIDKFLLYVTITNTHDKLIEIQDASITAPDIFRDKGLRDPQFQRFKRDFTNSNTQKGKILYPHQYLRLSFIVGIRGPHYQPAPEGNYRISFEINYLVHEDFDVINQKVEDYLRLATRKTRHTTWSEFYDIIVTPGFILLVAGALTGAILSIVVSELAWFSENSINLPNTNLNTNTTFNLNYVINVLPNETKQIFEPSNQIRDYTQQMLEKRGYNEITYSIYLTVKTASTLIIIFISIAIFQKRSPTSTFLITIEDFWGALIIGFLIGYTGNSIFNNLITGLGDSVNMRLNNENSVELFGDITLNRSIINST